MYTSGINKQTKCPTCKDFREFELVSGQVNGNSHILIVQCSFCGEAVGAIQDINFITEKIERLSKQ